MKTFTLATPLIAFAAIGALFAQKQIDIQVAAGATSSLPSPEFTAIMKEMRRRTAANDQAEKVLSLKKRPAARH